MRMRLKLFSFIILCIWLCFPAGSHADGKTVPAPEALTTSARPPVIFICVDTLRADHVEQYGVSLPVSHYMAGLLDAGVVLQNARTPIPLTGPAVASVLTSLQPHVHGATRNGVSIYPGQTLLSDILSDAGYQTAAVMSNWTLRNKLSGLGDHFEDYIEVFNRKRWHGFYKDEGSAMAVNEAALEWLDTSRKKDRPFFLWIHYIEPHTPYRFHSQYGSLVGQKDDEPADVRQRYATEVAFVDARIGELLSALKERGIYQQSLIVFFSDHGESLGEHSVWGHGRHCYEEGLRVPLGFIYPGVIGGGLTIEAQTTLLDVAPTVLGLLGLPASDSMAGRDLSRVCRGQATLEEEVCWYQAQKGAVVLKKNVDKGRSRGLLGICRIHGNQKEFVHYHSPPKVHRYNLAVDPRESRNLAKLSDPVPGPLQLWKKEVQEALDRPASTPDLTEEDIEKLRALGYLQ